MPIIQFNATAAELRFLKKVVYHALTAGTLKKATPGGWAVPKADQAGRWSWAVPDQAAPEVAVPQTTQVPQAASYGWTTNPPDAWGLTPPSKADGWGSSF
jgi:hypothetical protein